MPATLIDGPYVRVHGTAPNRNTTGAWVFQRSLGPYAREGELYGDHLEIWGRYKNACEWAIGQARDAEYVAILP